MCRIKGNRVFPKRVFYNVAPVLPARADGTYGYLSSPFFTLPQFVPFPLNAPDSGQVGSVGSFGAGKGAGGVLQGGAGDGRRARRRAMGAGCRPTAAVVSWPVGPRGQEPPSPCRPLPQPRPDSPSPSEILLRYPKAPSEALPDPEGDVPVSQSVAP